MKRNALLSILSLCLFVFSACVLISPPAAPAAEATTAPATTAGAATSDAAGQADTECAEGFRLFEHELLLSDPLCIPESPQRVIPLDMASLEFMLLIEQTPVGTAAWMLEEMPVLLPQYTDLLATLEGLGYPADLEKVAALQPDLILAPEDTIDVALASEIAPVIVPDPLIYQDWKIGMEFWGAVLNQADAYARMEANYFARVAELQAALGEPADLEVSVISVSTAGVWLWMPDTSPGAILADVGLSRPSAQTFVGEEAVAEYGDNQYITISEERLDLTDGDAIFYFTYASTDPETAAEESNFVADFQQKPLWLALNAVKAEKAFFVPGYWWRAQTYRLANMVLDDLFAHLTDTTATTPVLESTQ